jgi:Fic family protein
MSHFNPKFKIAHDVDEAATEINLPHEDYPTRVRSTADMLIFLHMSQYNSFSPHDIRTIHGKLWEDTSHAGKYREIPTSIGIEASLVPSAMDKLGTILHTGDLFWWYRNFQTIHPFTDGNGRVGGIVLASLSRIQHGFYIVENNLS